jgi:AcrR family transcriptional regulator
MKQKDSKLSQSYHHGDLRRVLIDAALELVNDEQNWDFSLREVARRAGVSHNAPYNHFASKRDLLVAIASAGFDVLRERLLAATVGVHPKAALVKIAVAYVSFGLENPTRYRLMFGSALATSMDGMASTYATADAGAKAVLEEVIFRGAQAGVLAASPRKKEEMQVLVLTAWSTVHGLTMVALDGLTETPRSKIPGLVEKVARVVCHGMFKKSHALTNRRAYGDKALKSSLNSNLRRIL